MKTRMMHLQIAVLLFACLPATAQRFELELQKNRLTYGQSVDQHPQGNYLVSTFVIDDNPGGGEFGNLSVHTSNGAFVWSKDYVYDQPILGGDALFWPQQSSILYGAFLEDDSLNYQVTKLDQNGAVDWAYRFGDEEGIFVGNPGNVELLIVDDNRLLVGGGALRLEELTSVNDIYLAMIGADGELIWANTYCFSCEGIHDAVFHKVIPTQDGGFLVTGAITRLEAQGLDQDILVFKVDNQGNLEWTKSYNQQISDANKNSETGTNLVELPNGRIVVTGWIKSGSGIQNQDGFLLELTPDGEPLRKLTFELLAFNLQLFPLGLLAKDNNTVVVSMGTDPFDLNLGELNLLMEITLNGAIQWEYNYDDETVFGYLTFNHDLIRTSDGGFGYLISKAVLFDEFYPILVKTNDQGETGCEGFVQLFATTNIGFETFDFSPTVIPQTIQQSINLSVNPFIYEVALPVLDLGPDREVCEGEQITLDASVPTADATYLWNDGTTNPIRNITESGTYAVEVSSEAECFLLVDTVTIDIQTLPDVEIVQDDSRYCEEGVVLLYAEGTASTGLLWSTGEATDSIYVDESGIYSVTITASCGQAIATTEVELGNRAIPVVMVEVNTEDFCNTGAYLLEAGGTDIIDFRWSNGATQSTISASNSGTYTVIASNSCFADTLDVVVELPELVSPTPVITVDSSQFCMDGLLDIEVSGTGINSLLWSTGETAFEISSIPADLELSIFSLCDVISLPLPLAAPMCECRLEVPNVFTPNNDGKNDTFTPVSNCDTFEDFEMRIYSRWGQEVFNSNNFMDSWDGGDLPSDVYVYVLKYRFIAGQEANRLQGDVTLVR